MKAGGAPLFRLRSLARATQVSVLLATLLFGRGASAQTAPAPFVPGRMLVKFQPGVTAAQVHNLLAAAGGQSVRQITPIGVHIVQLPPQANPMAVARAFGQRREVVFAEPDYILTSALLPN